MSSPTARSLAHLRRLGYIAEVVERWIPQVNRRRDLFGCADLIAVLPSMPILLIQSTSDANVSARINKALSEPRLRTWLKAGGAFTVHGWQGPRLREVPITLADTTGVPVEHRPARRKARREDRSLFADAIPAPLARSNAPGNAAIALDAPNAAAATESPAAGAAARPATRNGKSQ